MKGVIFYRRTFPSVEDNYVISMGDTEELRVVGWAGDIGRRLMGGFGE